MPTVFDSPIVSGGSVPSFEINSSVLSLVTGVLLSLALSYVPGLAQKWAEYPYKRTFLAIFGFVLGWAMVGLHYLGAVDAGLGSFGWAVVWRVVLAWLEFIGAAQGTYTVTRKLGH